MSTAVSGEVTSPCSQELADISVFPGDDEYHNSTLINNPAYSHLLPAFVALPKTVADVQRCLSCAYDKSVPFTMKSGGHSSAGYSTINGSTNGAFTIYLSKMNTTLPVSETSVKVQAGARWENVYKFVSKTDYLIVGGICPSVGVSGYTLGGGMSWLSRKFGLTIDNVLSLTMVTANGSCVVTANDTTNTDLYWALRGGGGGNFGVVVDFTYQLQPSFDYYWLGQLTFSGGTKQTNTNSSKALRMIGQFDFPSELLLDIYLNSSLVVTVVHLGPISQSTQKKLSSLKELASSSHFNKVSTYWDILNANNNSYPRIAARPYIIKGCLLKNISEGVVKILFDTALPKSCFHVFNHLGGAVSRSTPQQTAFFHRKSLFDMYSTCFFQNDAEMKSAVDFFNSLYSSMEGNGYCIGNYVNDMDRDLNNWQRKYYGGNYDRLLDIQKKWNPLDKGTYHFLQSIGSDYNPPLVNMVDTSKTRTEL